MIDRSIRRIHKPTAKKAEEEVVAKKSRRTALKLIFFGAGTFILGKFSGTITDFFSDKVISDTEFKNFKFVETQKELTVSEQGGEPLLIIDKDSYK